MAAHSPIFRDMLALPAPADAETFDGCPLVLLPDTAEDMTNFLKALVYYDFLAPDVNSNGLPTLLSVLRMSHKYDVAPLRKRILTQLSILFPTTLAGLKAPELSARATDSEAPAEADGDCIIALITTARQVSADWLLPFAFYELCRRTDEQRVVWSPALAVADKQRWVTGLRALETREVTRLLRFLWQDPPGSGPLAYYTCIGHDACVWARAQLRRGLFDGTSAPQLPLELLADADVDDGMLCGTCYAEFRGQRKAARAKLWARLPDIFALPGWEELEKAKADAFGEDTEADP
ncbi:BTB domain-containing protein [Mycena indigotica]|uniref:BTB domain-containing protein n=1 Tax=Mycena indigotica TaxID=2126181 RepID=A0A8H6S0C3_9AGAR|nr:BTB domain-containing protein [Mycena indigotica]KAF7289706.1 BTB domain-containing protein [Mycena indigotica]